MSPTANSDRVIGRARMLRRNMTDGERRLWSELKQFRRLYGIHVRKQAPFDPYIVDFVIHDHRLIVEVDGEHHFTADGLQRDAKRDAYLRGRGYRIIRFNTGELEQSFDGCVEEILGGLGLMHDEPHDLSFSPPPRTPPCKREEGVGVSETPSPLRGGVRGGGSPDKGDTHRDDRRVT